MTEININGQLDREISSGLYVEEIKIPVPWGHIAGRWWGSRDRQPILAIHGWQDNAGAWDNLIPFLPPDISVLCIDLPGHGLSTSYPTGMQYMLIWDGMVLVRRIVNYFEWTNVTLLGHSLGGAIGFMYAAAFPKDVDKLISIDVASPAVRDSTIIVTRTGWAIDKFLEYENLTEHQEPCFEYDEMIDIVFEAYKGSVSRENCKILMKRGMEPSSTLKKGKGYYFRRDPRLKVSLLGLISIDVALEYAQKITCRVLNIRAIPGENWERPDYYTAIIEKLKERKNTRYIEVAGTHHVHLEAPENIADAIYDFLEE